MLKTVIQALIVTFCMLTSVAAANFNTASIEMHEFRVRSEPSIDIYVRNKHLVGQQHFTASKTLIYVHGATYPAETAFDLRLDGMSWMDFIAAQGYDVYLLDVRGYGQSTRPPQMQEPAQFNPPFATTEDAVRDVSAVVEFVRQRRGVDKVNLLGWSWGTATMQWYTSLNSDKVHKLVLFAPVWIRETPSLVQAGSDKVPAYRTVTVEQAKVRWLTGVPEHKKSELIPKGWFEAWADATFATDPVGAAQTPAVLRAPNGVVFDGLRYWANGIIPWNPQDIKVPVLLIKGEWDQDTPAYMAQKLFAKLTSAPYKRYIEIGEATHTVIMEKNRMQLFNEVQLFLNSTEAF